MPLNTSGLRRRRSSSSHGLSSNNCLDTTKSARLHSCRRVLTVWVPSTAIYQGRHVHDTYAPCAISEAAY